MRICPSTPEELNSDKTMVAESGDEIDLVKTAMYSETGKYESAWRTVVVHFLEVR